MKTKFILQYKDLPVEREKEIADFLLVGNYVPGLTYRLFIQKGGVNNKMVEIKEDQWNIAKDHFVILTIQRIGNVDQKETK